MNSKILKFRNSCAEDGIELTPKEAKKVARAYQNLKDEIISGLEEYPGFYEGICNRTTEEKLEDINNIKDKFQCEMTLKEYNELQELIKKVCELEGFN